MEDITKAYQFGFARAGSCGIASKVHKALGAEIQPQILLKSAFMSRLGLETYTCTSTANQRVLQTHLVQHISQPLRSPKIEDQFP